MPMIVDFQGFKTENNRFLIKELAAFDGFRACHYIFKQPYSFERLPESYRRQARWVSNNHHGIEWDQGFTPLHQLSNILGLLSNQCDEIWVKGAEKTKFIQQYISTPVIELPDSPALQLKEAKCFYHSINICMCALSNVYELYNEFVMNN